MILPEFSEFTFGYAFTDNLVNRVLKDVKGVPIFPSLREEGKPGKGYDIEIPRYAAPLFLQFKLPQVITRRHGTVKHPLKAPYYRMHLMRRCFSSQHASLVQHANEGKGIFYVAPEFDSRDELNNFYEKGKVPLRSAFFDPKDIGLLEDDEAHHVAYRASEEIGWFCSAPRKLRRNTSSELFLSEVKQIASSARFVEDRAQFFFHLADTVVSATLRAEASAAKQMWELEGEYEPPLLSTAREPGAERERLENFKHKLGPARFASYVSQLYLDCALLVVGHD